MKKLNLLIIAMLFCSFAIGQNLAEGFETWPPDGWTIVQGECSTNDITQNGDQFYSGSYSARFSSYYSCASFDEYLVTRELITTAGDQTFSFWYRKFSYGSETFKVGWSTTGTDVSTDFTWGDEVANASTTWQQSVKTDLPVGTKYVAIHYYSDYAYYLYIDDVAGPEVVPIPMGTLDGTVTDLNTSLPLQDVLIEIVPSATKLPLTTDANGEYEEMLAVGMYDVTASIDNYFPVTVVDVVITADMTTVQDFELVFAIPANDECADAEAIGEVVDQPFDTEYATTSGVGGNDINQDIWYVYTATGDGTIDVDLCGSTFDTKLAVWADCGVTELAYDDDGCPSKTTRSMLTEVEVLSGEDYFIQVGGFSTNKGEGVISLAFTEAPLIPDPEFTVYELTSSIDKNEWIDVVGDLETGFEMDLIDWVEYHYLRLENAETNTPLDLGYHNFYLNQDNLPAGFMAYWAAQGVDGDSLNMNPWQIVVWDIINGDEPMIVLNAMEGPFKGQIYYIQDGFEIIYNSNETYPRINGDYPPGTYTFDGVLTAAGDTAVKSDLSFDITFNTVSEPEFTVLDLEQSFDQSVWTPILGDLANGWEMDLLDWNQFYYISISDAETNMPLDYESYPYVLDVTQLPDETAFYAYWTAKGVFDGCTGTWEPFMWLIVSGQAPMFYLDVLGDVKDYSQNMELVDGLQYAIGNYGETLRVSGDYPPGTYYFDGEIAANNVGKAVTSVTIEMTFNAIVPEFTALELITSIDETTWTDVQGDLLNGYNKLILPEQEYYYFDLGDTTETTLPLDPGYIPFTLDQTDLPTGYFDYWLAKGVFEGCTGTWEPFMWDIINGTSPMFYIRVEGVAQDQGFALIDGLQYLLGQGDKYLRVNGTYPAGTYTFNGDIISSGVTDATTEVSVLMTFVAPLDVPYAQDFEGDFPPEYWDNYLVEGTPWVQTDLLAYSGTYSAYHNDDNMANESWFVSPPIDLSTVSGDVFLIYFENVIWADYAAIQEVYISTDLTAFDDPSSASWVLLNDAIGPEDTWQQNIFDLSAYSGPVFIGFYYDGFFAAEWYIDDFQIVETGDIDGLVSNLNSSDPEEDVVVEIYNDDFFDTFQSDIDGNFLASGLPPGTYDVDLSKEGFYPITYEDIIVNGGATTTVTLDIEPVAPIILDAQYNDSQVTLEWEKMPDGAPGDNIDGTTISLNNDIYEPGQTLDLDFSFLYNSGDFEFICGFFLDFPDGVTVNSATDLDGIVGSSYLDYNGETGEGATCTWGIPSGNCGFGSLYSSGDFVVNVTIAEDFFGLIEIPYTIYGDMFGGPIHEVSGSADLATYEFNIYRSGGDPTKPSAEFEYLTTVMGFYHVDLEVVNEIEYCYYITQIIDGKEQVESEPSNTMCATPNLPPVIEVEPLSFYEVMNPDMIVTRTMTITNTTGGSLWLEFEIDPEEGGEKGSQAEPTAYVKGTDPVSAALAPIPENPNFKPTSYNIDAKGSTAWAYEAINANYVTFDTDDPYTFNSIVSPAPWAAYAGDFVTGDDSKLYIVNHINDPVFSFGTVDVATGVYTEIGPINLSYNDFACDKTTGVLYGVFYNGLTSDLYTIDITTGQETFVGNIGNTGGLMIAIAVDGEGNMWGHDLGFDEIWSIDKTSGAGVSVGPTGFDANYGQSMSWDPITNTVYLAAFNNSNFYFELRSVNLASGSTTLIGPGFYYNEVTVLGFPGYEAPVYELVSTNPSTGMVAPGDSFDVDVIFNSTGLEAGYYTNELHIFSNDLNTPEVVIPVAIEIFQPFLEVEAGHYSNELTITPIPDEPDGGLDNIEDSYIECETPEYLAGTTMDLEFYLSHYSPDYEYLDGVAITFPVGVTVNSASDCGNLPYNFETGPGVQVTWGDINGGSGWGDQNGDAYFTVNVTIDPGFTGEMLMDWMIAGDAYGSVPHFVDGTTSVSPWAPFETTFNIYRDGDLIAEEVGDVYVDDGLDSNVEYCYTVTQNYESIPPSAHSELACGTPWGDGDRCEVAFEYAVVDDDPVFGSTTYTGDFVWYSVENPETQDFFVSLCGSSFDTKVAVYKSCDDWNGEFPTLYDPAGAIAFNDDSYTCGGGEYTEQSLTHVSWAAPGTYYVLIWGYLGASGDYALEVYSEQSQLTRVGWGGVSTYVDLDIKGTSMEEVFEDVNQQLTILINEDGIYWPSQNINSIGDFDTYNGHKAKWNAATTWIVEGDIVDSRVVTFPAGTHFLPVLNVTPVAVQGFITDVAGIDFMFDLDNTLVYWPDGGITPGVEGSLEILFPGSAYLFKCSQEVTFDFGPYAPVDYAVTIPDNYFKTFENNTTWNDVLKTGDHHIVGLSQSALNKLEAGDYIGTFNNEGICVGMQLYAGREEALAIAVNGNDITTRDIDGMMDQEMMNFRVYRDGQVYDVNPIYNAGMPNYDGAFNMNGLSQIIDFKFGPLSIEENPMSAVMIYPNPSTGIFNIDLEGFESTVKMEVLNARGQLIFNAELNTSYQLDLTAQPQGVYFIRLVNSSSVHLEKVIVK